MEHNNLQEMLQSFMQQQQQMIQQTLHQNAQVARQEMQQEIQKINQGLLGRFEHVDQRVDALIEEKQKSDQKVERTIPQYEDSIGDPNWRTDPGHAPNGAVDDRMDERRDPKMPR